jgi:CRP-like cAMP-binding protein
MPVDHKTARSVSGVVPAAVAPENISLAEIVPAARPVDWAGSEPGQINEIPLDGFDSLEPSSADSALDLRLGKSACSSTGPDDDVAAAQAVSLPRNNGVDRSARQSRREPSGSLRSELANLPLFEALQPATLHELMGRVRVVVLAQGQILFRQGDPANALYLVVEGAVVPIAEGAEGEGRRKLAVIERGDFVGEIGLMTKQPRNATVAALVETKLVALDRSVLVPLMRREPSVAQGILRFLRARMLDRQIRSNLFFAAFAHAERGAVARQFRLLEVKDGTRVALQGQPPEGLFVVLAGSLAKLDRTHARELGRLELGDVFGGDWLLEGKPSPWDVVACGRAWLIVLGERRFRRIVDANPRLVRVLDRLARRKTKSAAKGDPSISAHSSAPTPRRPSPSSLRAASADRARRSRS